MHKTLLMLEYLASLKGMTSTKKNAHTLETETQSPNAERVLRIQTSNGK